MSMEIRKVIPNWEHPKQTIRDHRGNIVSSYIPLRDRCVQEVFEEWLFEYQEWCKTDEAKAIAPNDLFRTFCHDVRWAISPDKYRPSWDENAATWFQVYETVSDGTPITPPFETEDELIEYLVTKGDFWKQEYKETPWSREAATSFVKDCQWLPSGATFNGEAIDLTQEIMSSKLS